MAEKKKTSNKKTTTKKVNETKKQPVAKKTKVEKVEVKKEIKKEVVKPEVKTVKKEKKECKLRSWFKNLTIDQIVVGGVVTILILLIVLIIVSTKNTKTKNGDDIVATINGKTITANELYSKLKEKNGYNVTIDMIDEYILEKEYKTTDEMKASVKSTVDSYKNTYGDSYEAFLQYNGIADEAELKAVLLKNTKLSKVVEKYIKDKLTEKEMKKYYEESIVGDISAKHILIKTDAAEDATEEEIKQIEEKAKKEAESLIARLKNGEDFSTLAKEYSQDEASKSKGGDLGYFNKGAMVQEFEDAAYKLEVNEYTTEPVKTTYGYHIILKTGQKDKPSYKKSKDTIIEKLIEEKQSEDQAISVKALVALREKYNLNIKDKTVKKAYKDYIEDATKSTESK